MAKDPLVPREELRSTLEAARELGPAYEDELVERFAARLEQRLEERVRKRAPERDRKAETGITIATLVFAIPLLGIAGGTAGLAGIVVVCAALVLVNLVVRRQRS